MEPRAYAVDPEFAADIRETVRRVLGEFQNAQPQQRGPRFQGSNVQLVRVTGASTTLNGIRYWPGRVQTWDVSAGAWSDLTTSDVVKLFQYGDFDLTEDGTTAYESRLVATGSFSGTTYPVFMTYWRAGLVTDASCVDGAIEQTKTK